MNERAAQALRQMLSIEGRMPEGLWRDAPLSTSVEIANLLARFATDLTDKQCGRLLGIGAALIRVDRELSKTATADMMARLGLKDATRG